VHAGGTDLGTGLAFAIDAARGEVLWKSPTDGGSYAAPRLAEIDSARQLFVFHRGGLTCFDRTTEGAMEIPVEIEDLRVRQCRDARRRGDICLISATYGTGAVCFKVKKDAFEVIWKDDLESRRKSLETHWSTAIPLDGRVYGFSGRHESGCDLRCVELATGKVLWTRRATSAVARCSTPTATSSSSRTRRPLPLPARAEGPKELRRVRGVLAYPSWAPPVLANGVLYSAASTS
jgi:outer membrane protein assembly factor BamB